MVIRLRADALLNLISMLRSITLSCFCFPQLISGLGKLIFRQIEIIHVRHVESSKVQKLNLENSNNSDCQCYENMS